MKQYVCPFMSTADVSVYCKQDCELNINQDIDGAEPVCSFTAMALTLTKKCSDEKDQ